MRAEVGAQHPRPSPYWDSKVTMQGDHVTRSVVGTPLTSAGVHFSALWLHFYYVVHSKIMKCWGRCPAILSPSASIRWNSFHIAYVVFQFVGSTVYSCVSFTIAN